MANEFKIKNGYLSEGNSQITGSLNVSAGITGSLFGTSSYAIQALSASYIQTAQTASYVLSASYAVSSSFSQTSQTSSYVLQAVSASYALTASYVSTTVSASYALTASYVQNAQSASYVLNAVSASYALSSSNSLRSNVASTIDINVFGSDVESYLLMSNVAGTTGVAIGGDADLRYNTSTNKLSVGSVSATSLTGSLLGTASYASQSLSSSYSVTASYYGGSVISASYATTASYVQTAQTASYVQNAVSASYATNASSASVLDLYSITSNTNSYLLFSNTIAATGQIVGGDNDLRYNSSTNTLTAVNISASSLTGSLLGTASYSSTAVSASYAQTASYVLNAVSASFATTASRAITSSFALTASYVLSSSYAQTASYIQNAQSASYVLNAVSASYAATASYLNTLNQNLTLNGNFTVNGTASYSYVTASQLNVGTNFISVNVSEPAERFGGLKVYDSGSLSHLATASLAWDSTNNHWIYQNASGSTYSGGMLLAGPRNTGSLGDEQSLTRWFVARSDGGDHLNDTQIFSSGSIHIVTGSLTVTSGITGSLLGTASFATQATTAYTASYVQNAQSASYVLNAVSASYAATASYVNTLNQSVIVTASMVIGSSSLGPNENTLTLGARDSANEGGQLGLNAPGGTYTSASFIDVWSNQIRILRGTNDGSDGLVTQWNLHTKQMQLPAYTNASSFPGTATANLAIDSGGNIITVSTTGGSVFPYVGNAVITGSLTTTGIIYAQPNGGMYFQGGDDAALYDINVANTMGIYGMQTVTEGAIKLGSNGPVLYGSGSRLGLGTTTPTSASLTVNGNVWANSFTGSLQGTSSYATQALSASYALSATTANTASYVQNAQTASYVQTAQTASYVLNAISSSYALSASFSVSSSRAVSASFATTASYYGGSVISASYAATASYVNPLIQNVIVTGSLDISGSFIAYDESNVKAIQANLSKRSLFDTSAVVSVNWSGRGLYTPSSILAIDWSYNNYLDSNVYQRDYKSATTQNAVSNTINNAYSSYLGDIIEVDGVNTIINGTVNDGMLVYLDTDATWYPVNQSSTTATKMIGIACNVAGPTGFILLEGHVVIDDSGANRPTVTGADHGLPVYIEDSTTNGRMSTTLPTTAGGNNVIRVVGHCYWNNTGTSSQWMMKFRPSNDWITI
jgi:hypothetical protein